MAVKRLFGFFVFLVPWLYYSFVYYVLFSFSFYFFFSGSIEMIWVELPFRQAIQSKHFPRNNWLMNSRRFKNELNIHKLNFNLPA